MTNIGYKLVLIMILSFFALQFIYLTESLNSIDLFASDIGSTYIVYAFRTAMFVGIAMLVWVENERLEYFHLDKYTMITFVTGSLLRWRWGILGEGFFLALIGLSGVLVIATIVIKKSKVPRTDLQWVLIAIITAAIFIFTIAYLGLYFGQSWTLHPLLEKHFILTIIRQLHIEISTAALLEEIIFRGFLWGYLKSKNWGEMKIIWIQGLLFWLCHFSRIVTPLTFFVSIPLTTLISTVMTLRSKQVFPAILSHTIINVIGVLLTIAAF